MRTYGLSLPMLRWFTLPTGKVSTPSLPLTGVTFPSIGPATNVRSGSCRDSDWLCASVVDKSVAPQRHGDTEGFRIRDERLRLQLPLVWIHHVGHLPIQSVQRG